MQHGERFAILLGGARKLRQRYFGLAAKNGHRCAQFMGSVRNKTPLAFEGSVEAIQQLVEGPGQPAELVVWIAHLEPLVQIGGANIFSLLAHCGDGRETYVCAKVAAETSEQYAQRDQPGEGHANLLQHFLLRVERVQNHEQPALAIRRKTRGICAKAAFFSRDVLKTLIRL